MTDNVLPKPEPQALDNLLRKQAVELRANDEYPRTQAAWERRKETLRQALHKAMRPFPESPCQLEPQMKGVLKRDGYRIEKLLLQSRPDVWITASAYVPEGIAGKRPAVLVVHGHWPWARRDPVVQARCLGLVKLGFFVLAVDAFGAGERFTEPGKGTYHGALYGATLWPAGHTLLGMQVYDNRRAVDYLLTRPEVDGTKLGVTGASGGGNQSMYAGALDERFQAVAPVCSVGTYQAYLHAACCVCEVLPGALRFTEESEVLALTAPRALLVVNATQDGFQFSVGEAAKSLEKARLVFQLYRAQDKIKHAVVQSGHAYNQAMREAMYGWMTRWLKGEGEGKPIPEPAHQIEEPETLACFADGGRPKTFFFPPAFAAREARTLLKQVEGVRPSHIEEWESQAAFLRNRLRRELLGDWPKPQRPAAQMPKQTVKEDVQTTSLVFQPEPGLPMPALLRVNRGQGKSPACILLHLGGKTGALADPLAKALVEKGWTVLAPDLRGTGETKPANDLIAGAPDYNSAEHALWIGRPLLGQWLFDVQHLLEWLAIQPGLNKQRLFVAGLGQASLIALAAAALFEDRVAGAISVAGLNTLVTETAYAPGTHMGLLAPGLFRYADVPHLAALIAPRKLIVADGVTPQGQRTILKDLTEAFAYPRFIYRLLKSDDQLKIDIEIPANEIAARL